MSVIVDSDALVKRQYPMPGGSFCFSLEPNDPIGVATVSLTNIAVGSSVQIETQAGALVEYRVAEASTEVFAMPVYASGSPLNDLRIKVRKGSAAPYYRPYETQATAQVGSASIFVSQIPE